MLRWKNKSGVAAAIVAAASLMAVTKSYATNGNPTWDNQTWIDSAGAARMGSGSAERDNRGTKAGVVSTPAFDISDISILDPNVRKVASDLASLLGDNQTITAKCSGGKGSFNAIKAPTTAIPTAGNTPGPLSLAQMGASVDFDLVFDRQKGYAIYKNGVAVTPILHEINNKSAVAEGVIKNFHQVKFLNKYTRYIQKAEYAGPVIYIPDLFVDKGTNVPAGYVPDGHAIVRPENSPLAWSIKTLFNSTYSPNIVNIEDISETVTRNDCKKYQAFKKPPETGCFICLSSNAFWKTNTVVNTSCPVPTGNIDINKSIQLMGGLMGETHSTTVTGDYKKRVAESLQAIYSGGPLPIEYSYESVLTSVNKAGLVLTHEKDQNGVYTKNVKVKVTPLGQTDGGSLLPIYPIAHKVFDSGTGFFYKADGSVKTEAAKPSSSQYPVNTYSSDSTLTCTFAQ